jgi:HK97 family phage major capsid protein
MNRRHLTAAHQAFLANTFARNRRTFGGFTMEATKRERLATLRAEAATLTTALTDGTADETQIARASEVAQEIATLQRQITEEEGQTDDGSAQRAQAAEAARRALAGLPADPAPRTPGDRDDQRQTEPRYTTRDRREDLRTGLQRVAEEFAESRSYADFVSRGLNGSAVVDVQGVTGSELAMRATVLSTDSPSRNPYLPGILEPAYRPMTLLDMVDRQTTGLDSIPFIQETTADPGAGATEVAEGAAKPEVATTLAEADSPVRTIAAWLNITRQAAEDKPTVAGYLQGRLGFKVLHRLNSQILNGNGTAPNLRGILNTVGINTYAPGAAEARIISIRKAITQCQVDEYFPETVILSPGDWELVELSTDSAGQFRVSPNVQQAMTRTIWGLAVIVDTIVAFGTAVVGAFRLGATLWERHGVRILMTDSHASNFTSNILTILAELRAALTVWRPSAFCKVTFNGTI